MKAAVNIANLGLLCECGRRLKHPSDNAYLFCDNRECRYVGMRLEPPTFDLKVIDPAIKPVSQSK